MSLLQHVSTAELEMMLRGDLGELSENARELFLDHILAWANLDGSTAFLAAQLGGLNPDEGANRFGRKIIEQKLKAAGAALVDMGEPIMASIINDASAEYAERALIRRRICHSRCVGSRLSQPDRVVFMPYETEGNGLAVEVYTLAKVAEQTEWARQLHAAIMQFVDAKSFFDQEQSQTGVR